MDSKQRLSQARERAKTISSDRARLESLKLDGEIPSLMKQGENLKLLGNKMAVIIAKLKKEKPTLQISSLNLTKALNLIDQSSIEWSEIEGVAIRKAKEGVSAFDKVPKTYWNAVLKKAEKQNPTIKLKPAQPEKHLASLKTSVEQQRLRESNEKLNKNEKIRSLLYFGIIDLLSSGKISLDKANRLKNIHYLTSLKPKFDQNGQWAIDQLSALTISEKNRVDIEPVIQAAIGQYRRDKPVAQVEIAKKGKENFWDKISNYTKTFYREHTMLSQVAMVAGATVGGLALYRLYKYLSRPKPKSSKGEAGFGTISFLVAGVASVLGLGILLKNTNKLGEWLKEQVGFGLDDVKNVKAATGLLADGKVVEAFQELVKTTDPEADLHAEATTKFKEWGVEIPNTSMRLVSTMSYKAFMDQEESWVKHTSAKLNQLQAAFKGDQTLKDLYEARPDLSNGNENLHDIFETLEETKGKNGKPIFDRNHMQTLTVDEALRYALSKDLSKAKERFKEKVAADQEMSLMYGTLEYNRKLFGEVSTNMLEDFKWMLKTTGGQSVYSVVEHFQNKLNDPEKGFEWGDPIDFMTQVIDQCNQQKIPIAISATGVLIYDGVKWLTIASVQPIASFFYETAQTGSLKKGLVAYGIGASPFILYGVTKGALLTPGGILPRLRQAAWGGMKGGFAPLKVVELAYDAQFYGQRVRQYTGSKFRLAKTKGRELILKGPKQLGLLKEVRIRSAADRILALLEKKHLLSLKLEEKLAIGARHQWDNEIDHIDKEIRKLTNRISTLGKSPKEMLIRRSTLQLEKFYGKKMSPGSLNLIAKRIGSEMVDAEKFGNTFTKNFLLERHSSKTIRFLNKINYNESFIRALSENSDLMTSFSNKKVLRNKDFMKLMKEGLSKGLFSTAEGKLDIEMIQGLATEAENRKGFARRMLKSLKDKMGKNFDKYKSKLKQRQAFQAVARQYQRAAEVARKARGIPGRLAKGALLKLTTVEAKTKLNELSKIAKPDAKTQKEIARLTKHINKNKNAMVEIMANNKLKEQWKLYKELIKKSGGEIPASSMLSPTRFLKYRGILNNAERFAGHAKKFEGYAFVLLMIHTYENGDSKIDHIGRFTANTAGFIGGAKLAKLGIKAPGPIYVKALAGALGMVAGVAGAHYLEEFYSYSARTVGDRYFTNRGQSNGVETAFNATEILGGMGINNFAEVFDATDTWNNIDLDEVINEDGHLNPLAYQEFLQANSIHLTDWKRHFYRDTDDWDREIQQLLDRNEEEIKSLEEEAGTLNVESEKFDEVQSEIEKRTEAIPLIKEYMMIRIKGIFNKKWDMMQTQLLFGEEYRLEEQREKFIDRLPPHDQAEANALISKMQERLLTDADIIIDEDNEREVELWKMLRDRPALSIRQENTEREIEEVEFTFPEWFLQFKDHLKRQRVYEEIRDHGKIRDVSLSGKFREKATKKQEEEPSKEGQIEHLAQAG